MESSGTNIIEVKKLFTFHLFALVAVKVAKKGGIFSDLFCDFNLKNVVFKSFANTLTSRFLKTKVQLPYAFS